MLWGRFMTKFLYRMSPTFSQIVPDFKDFLSQSEGKTIAVEHEKTNSMKELATFDIQPLFWFFFVCRAI